jgi:WHG domain-containing protein
LRACPRTDDPTADLVRAGLAFRRFAIDHPSLFAIGVQRTARLADESWHAPNASRIAALSVLEDWIARLRSARLPGERTVRSTAVHFHAYCEGMAALELRCGVPIDNATMEPLWVEGLTAILHGFQTSTTSDASLAAAAGDTLVPD